MDFLILRALPPKNGYHFSEGGVGGGMGRGVKNFRSKGYKQWRSILLSHHQRSSGNAADVKFLVGGSNPGRPTLGGGGGGGGAKFARSGFEPPTKGTPAGCTTTRPLLGLRCKASLLLCAASATDKKPKLCVSV